MLFRDRKDAGLRLAELLKGVQPERCAVIGIPRGGVEVGFYVAVELGCPLEVTVPRKIGAPMQPELAVGAVAEDGTIYIEEEVAKMVGVDEGYLKSQAERELDEVRRRIQVYREGRELPDLSAYTVIAVDDGVATGATMIVSLRFLRKKGASRLVCAIPVAPPETLRKLRAEADEVICSETPEPFYAIGQFYQDFRQLTDQDVLRFLSTAKRLVK